jgi:alkanesulfonate monooxygenase SsuD/methylene tetrahydromethanopterin reductase-like flavin-dependent oxidoreductase (luciferase family)
MALVAKHADWWNLHTGLVDKLDELRPAAGAARVSIQQMVAFVPSEDQRSTVAELAARRFGPSTVVGDAHQLIDHYGALAAKGVERVYAWFTDFAPPETLAAFGETVVPHLA